MTQVKPGIDVLRDRRFFALKGKRVALLSNASGVDSKLNSSYQILWEAEEVNLVALFAPEHGFAAAVSDGELIDTHYDTRTGLPIFSLYGASYRPSAAMLESIDVIVCDIQDIGLRYYTFTWTITHVLEVAGECGVEVIILDRPNPLGGEIIAGGLLQDGISSLVGPYPVPIQHGMTLAEVVHMVNREWNAYPADLSLILCQGWEREMLWEDTDLIWIPPSPNMPQVSTLKHYGGACLIEGTNLSEGRGTTLPFEILGAPYLDGISLAEHLNQQAWEGVRFRAHTFIPTASKFAGEICYGVQAHLSDERSFDAIRTWLGVIHEIRLLYPVDFAWIPPYTQGGYYHFDRLIGSYQTRQDIDAGLSVDAIMNQWSTGIENFRKLRSAYLLYGGKSEGQ